MFNEISFFSLSPSMLLALVIDYWFDDVKLDNFFFSVTLNAPCIMLLQIAAICQEAGMHAVRKNRYVILPKDFEKGYRTNVKKPETDFDFYKWANLSVELVSCLSIEYLLASRWGSG